MPGGRPGRANLRTLQVIQSLERAGFLRKVAAAPDINGRPPLRWDVHPVLIDLTTPDGPAQLIIEAVKPFSWIDRFPRLSALSHDDARAIAAKWGDALK